MESRSSENLSTDLSEDLIESGVLEGSEERGSEGRIVPASVSSSRTSFTSLSQVDSDLALARALQQQVCLWSSYLSAFNYLGKDCWVSVPSCKDSKSCFARGYVQVQDNRLSDRMYRYMRKSTAIMWRNSTSTEMM